MSLTAKEKNRKERLHQSGGGDKPAKKTSVEQAIDTILGCTPTFTGVVGRCADSAIVMKKTENNNDLQAKVCNAKRTGATSNLARAINSGKYIKTFKSKILWPHNVRRCFLYMYVFAFSL